MLSPWHCSIGMKLNGRKAALLHKTPVPIALHNKRDAVPSKSITLAWCFLCIFSTVAVPAVTLDSQSDTGGRGNVTVISKAAEIPPIQLTKALVGRDLVRSGLVHYLLQSSLQGLPYGKNLQMHASSSWLYQSTMSPSHLQDNAWYPRLF